MDLAQLHPSYTTDGLFEQLWALHPKEYGKVMMYGEKKKTPRYQQSYGRAYHFSGMNHEALPIPSIIQPYLDMANLQAQRLNHAPYSQVLVNWYENGHHYIGLHRDDEKSLVPDSTIFSLSLGATRKFRIREYGTKKIVKDIMLENGMVVIMGGRMQKDFTHEIVKIAGAKGESTGRRINITFRVFTNE